MNIQMQVCGLFIMILLFIFYKSHSTLRLYSEKVFLGTMSVAFIDLVLDILSLIVIRYRNNIPDILVEMVCKSYIVTIIWVSMFALSYVLTDLFVEKVHKRRTKKMVLITAIETVIVFLFPLYIYVDEKHTYSYGPAVMLVYVFALINICLIIFMMVAFYRRMNRRRVYAVGLWMLIWICAAMIQFFNNQLLIVGFASSIGILILFVIMENPEANIDRKLGCFNAHALSEFIEQIMKKETLFEMIEIHIDDNCSIEEQRTLVQSVIRKAILNSDREKQMLVFKNINSDIMIISTGHNKLYATAEYIYDSLEQTESLKEKVKIMMLPHAEGFESIEIMFDFLTFMHNECLDNEEKIYIASENMINKYKERFEVERRIAEALNEDRVEVFLQPIYSNEEKRFTSAEALARIRECDGQLLSPGIFIPVAETSGQIVELGERVIEKVCNFLKNTDAIEYGIHYIEVNLSVIQCEMKDLADRLIAIVERYNVDPKLINLEITETASISARTTLLENMKKLIDYGFTFSLDDFGKGESNLMYVVEMPVSLVKLDYDMSKAFFNSSKAKHVVRAVVNMAHGMDLKLVAEGIETKEEIDGMYDEGIDYIQGYYYAKPLPMDKFLDYLKMSANT